MRGNATNKDSMLIFEPRGEITVAHVQAVTVLDADNVNHFGEEALSYVSEHPGTNLLLDFQHVAYLSSAVLTELIKLKNTLEGSQGSVRLCSLNPQIRKVFEITNLDQVFVIEKDVETAIPKYERSLAVEREEKSWDTQ